MKPSRTAAIASARDLHEDRNQFLFHLNRSHLGGQTGSPRDGVRSVAGGAEPRSQPAGNRCTGALVQALAQPWGRSFPTG